MTRWSHLSWCLQNSALSSRVSYTQPGANMATEKLCFRMTSRAFQGDVHSRSHTFQEVSQSRWQIYAASHYLVRLQHSSDHFAAGEHVDPDVDVGIATPGAAEGPHRLQALLCPVVVGEETVAGVEKHAVMDRQVKTRRIVLILDQCWYRLSSRVNICIYFWQKL